MLDAFSSKEDELNVLLDKLTKTISAFSTLSREQAEKAIIETNVKIKEGQFLIEKMNDFLKDNENNISKEETIELNKRVNNYKNEFNDLVNKFNKTQSTYINKKAETALIDDNEVSINNNQKDLIDIEEKKTDVKNIRNSIQTQNKNYVVNINNIELKKNIENLTGANNFENNYISEEVFKSVKNKARKKKKIFCGIILILSVILISVLFFFVFYRKNINN
jgi:hypothetical protein